MRQGIKYAKQMWVHPDFLKKVKKDAVDKEMSIIDYTRFLSKDKELPFINNFQRDEGNQNIQNKRKTYLGLRL